MANPYPIEIQDESGVERLVGEATFTDPGNQPGGGGGPLPIFELLIYTPLGSTFELPSSLSPDPGTGTGAAGNLLTLPPQVFAIGNVVLGASVAVVTSGTLSSTNDPLDYSLSVWVTDATGTNVASINVSDALPAPVTDIGNTLDLTGGTWTIVSGLDLSDAGGGDLASAAGGVYTISVFARVSWD